MNRKWHYTDKERKEGLWEKHQWNVERTKEGKKSGMTEKIQLWV